MGNDVYGISVEDVENLEDGGCVVTFDISEAATKDLTEIGLKFLLYCAAYKVSTEFVLENIVNLKQEVDVE